jgi:hypothetical protein
MHFFMSMKTLFLSTCFALSAIITQAQELIRPISAGFRAGANLSGAIQDNIGRNNPGFGATGGLALNYQIVKKHAIGVEALYSYKNFTQPDLNVKNTMSYIDLPLLYKHTFYSEKKAGNVSERLKKGHFFFVAGPQLSVLLSSKAKNLKTDLTTEGGTTTTDLYANTRPFDLSAVAGMGYKLKNGLSIDTRYALGLRHLHGANSSLVPDDAVSSSVQIGITYLMPVNF